MDKKKCLFIIGIFILLVTLATACYFLFRSDDIERLEINGGNESTEVNDEVIGVDSESGMIIDTDKENNVIIDDVNVSDDDISNTYSEDDVVSYFEDIYSMEDDNSFDSFKDNLKNGFISIVDFIFYDAEINGYTFKELGNIAKLKIIGIALKMDSKIEEYIPEYKEAISSTSGKVYTDIKMRLVTLYLDISSEVCSNHQDGCATAKEIFNDVKSVCKISWDFIKGLLKSGKDKLRNWYEFYSGK